MRKAPPFDAGLRPAQRAAPTSDAHGKGGGRPGDRATGRRRTELLARRERAGDDSAGDCYRTPLRETVCKDG